MDYSITKQQRLVPCPLLAWPSTTSSHPRSLAHFLMPLVSTWKSSYSMVPLCPWLRCTSCSTN